MEADEPTAVASRFLRAFSTADFEGMRALLAGDVRAYVTNAGGGRDAVERRDDYLRRIEAMDRALVMVEVRARKGESVLHNFAAHLLRVADGRITEWWMVDAKPAEGDRFWS